MGTVKLTSGRLAEMFETATRAFIDKIDANYHASVYVGEHQPYFAESEFAGKYLDTCVTLARYFGAVGRKADSETALTHARLVAESIIANQREDGYIGGLAEGMELHGFSVWNQGFTMLGLLAYYELTGDRRALECSERICEYNASRFMGGADICAGGNNGSQHLSFLLPLVRLARLSEKPVCRDFVRHIVNAIRASDNNFFEFESILDLRSKKGIENFVILIGILEYGEEFGDESALPACVRYWDELAATQIRENGNGTYREVWTEGGNAPRMLCFDMRPDENCVAVGWIELSLALYWRLGEAKYLDAVEVALYNHLLGALDASGCDFAYYQPNYGRRITHTDESMYKCCRYRGYSAVSHLPDMLFRRTYDALELMVYAGAEYEDETVRIVERGGYPYGGDVRLALELRGEQRLKLKLRIPPYARSYALMLDGVRLDCAAKEGFVELDLSGEGSHELSLELALELEWKYVTIDGVKRVGARYGCLLLAFEEECEDAEMISVKPESGTARLVDYASAGREREFAVWARVRE